MILSRPIETAAIFAARLLLAAIFLHDGWGKIIGFSGAAAYMQAYGLPAALLPLAIVVEFGCGLLVAAGLYARLAALALAGFCLATAMLFHTKFSETNQLLHFEKNLAIAGGFLALFAHGAGPWSLDARIRRSERPAP